MLDIKIANDPLLRDYEDRVRVIAVNGPEWFAETRTKGFRAYSEFGVPTTRDEEFKYLPLNELSDWKLGHPYGATLTRESLEATVVGKIDAVTLVFVNGEFSPELSSSDTLPEGIFVGTLAEGAEGFEQVVKDNLAQIATYQGKLGSTNDPRFVELNNALLSEGAFVYIQKNKTLERPIHVVFVNKAEEKRFTVTPRLLVVLEENAEAKILESHIGLGGEYLSIPVAEVRLAKSARLEHDRFQQETLGAYHISNTFVHQEGQSVYTSNNANFGGKSARNDINAYVNGEYAETWLNGANVATGDQVMDNHTRIDHALPNCQSFEIYKSILKDNGTGVFNGKIFVYEDAQKTDAKQTNQAILLSPTATMNTKPQLEIFADDVKCTHGATIGQLRDDAMFYLRARGVPKAQAEALLVYAFAAEVLEKITIEEAKDALEAVLFEKLA